MSEVLLEVKNLNIEYPDKKIVSNGDFKILKGEIVLILGDNGAGKSSILKSLIMTKDMQGFATRDLYYKNKKIDKNQLDFFRASIGYAMQEDEDDPLFTTKVKDYILDYARDSVLWNSDDNIDEIYNDLFINKMKCDSYAEGKLNSRKLRVCSGGEKRIVSVLRAFSRANSELFILDEPINNLDSRHARILNNHINRLKALGKSILIVTHCQMFQNVDRVYQLRDGLLKPKLDYSAKSCFGECIKGFYKED